MAGIYNWIYPTGSFSVCLRPNGVFFCKSFNTPGRWEERDGGVYVDWQKYGKVQFAITGPGQLEGSLIGFPDKWRKLSFLAPFSDAEMLLMGNGGGSVWNLQWEGGNFEVEFRVDGLNHFVCTSFPAHSHWSMDGDRIALDWGKFGTI